jgi:hypothetical protein
MHKAARMPAILRDGRLLIEEYLNAVRRRVSRIYPAV